MTNVTLLTRLAPLYLLTLLLGPSWGSAVVFLLLRGSVTYSAPIEISIVGQLTESVESSFLIHQGGYHDLYVCP